MIDETAEEIREMQTHSSSVVAIKATRALKELTTREFTTVEEYVRTLERNATVLRRANPSHASLQNAVREVVEEVRNANPETVEEAKGLTSAVIEDVVAHVESGKHRAAEKAADYLTDGTTILTHDYSSTVLEALDIATNEGKEFSVYVTEARPRYLGRKMVRTLAAMDGIEPTLITDGASGYYLPEIDEVVLGMSCIVEDTLYNRVATYPLVAAAHQSEVQVTIVGSAAKVIAEGFVFENEFRSPSEVTLEPPEGFTVKNPAYDATPVALIDTVITEDGPQSA